MIAYFDSSVLLTILLNQERYEAALYFKKNSSRQNIILCSFDKNMLAVAKKLEFEINPVNI